MKKYIIMLLLSSALSVILGFLIIPILKRIKAGQPIYEYVKEHKSKNGTPTMGGLFFVFASVISFIFLNGSFNRLSYVAASIGLAYMLVGFLDDFLKIKKKENEGLKAYQKIIFQVGIGLIAGIFSYYNSLTIFYVPFVKIYVDLKWFTIPIVTFIFIAITNSVNLTDGLDSLAGGTSFAYLLSISLLIGVEILAFNVNYLAKDELNSLIALSVCLMGGLMGFLLFNVNKANVFMGDTGSLSLGGFIGAISIFSGNSFFIPIIGIMFMLSSISVIIQVLYYKKTKKRIFLMAPLHHHFQHKGYTESKISYAYTFITMFFGLLSVVFYL